MKRAGGLFGPQGEDCYVLWKIRAVELPTHHPHIPWPERNSPQAGRCFAVSFITTSAQLYCVLETLHTGYQTQVTAERHDHKNCILLICGLYSPSCRSFACLPLFCDIHVCRQSAKVAAWSNMLIVSFRKNPDVVSDSSIQE